MSHFTQVKTEIKNKVHLISALQQLGFEVESGKEGLEIENFFGDRTKVDLRVKTGHKYDIGFIQNENGVFEMTSDWELLGKMKFDCEKFQQDVMQTYSLVNVKSTLAEQGYEIDENMIDEEGNIQLVVSKW